VFSVYTMGIPSQKHLKSSDLPDGHRERTEGEVVEKGDKVWSTSEAKFVPVRKFPTIVGEPVTEFWQIITQENGNV